MSEQLEVIEIDGVNFKMAKLDGEAGRGLALDVMRIMGPSLTGALAGDFGAMFLGLSSGANKADVDRIVNILGGVSRVELEPGSDKWKFVNVETRKTFFTGRQSLQFQWIGKAIHWQLADFFVVRTPA
jgi:hypothetical protein